MAACAAEVHSRSLGGNAIGNAGIVLAFDVFLPGTGVPVHLQARFKPVGAAVDHGLNLLFPFLDFTGSCAIGSDGTLAAHAPQGGCYECREWFTGLHTMKIYACGPLFTQRRIAVKYYGCHPEQM